jgi:arylsulfatase A
MFGTVGHFHFPPRLVIAGPELVDRLATAGARFSEVLACPVCSPTRGEFLTGQYNFKIGLPYICGRNGAVEELDVKSHVTLAQLLRDAGYVTAMAGKWHLTEKRGGAAMQKTLADTGLPHITAAGFERQYQHPNGMGFHGYRDRETGEFQPAWYQQWVLRFLEEQAKSDKPFFLYYPNAIPHSPWAPTPLHPDGPMNAPGKGLVNFPDMMEYLDRQVGEVVAKVRELGLAENTLIIFAGDNGTEGIGTVMADGRYFRGGTCGVGQNARVPLIVSWPGTVKPGTVIDDLVDFTDLMPTFLELAGVKPPPGLDGVSFAPRLFGRPGTPRGWMISYWVNTYAVRNRHYALREDGKLYDISNTVGNGDEVTGDKLTPAAQAARAELEAVETRYGLREMFNASAKKKP